MLFLRCLCEFNSHIFTNYWNIAAHIFAPNNFIFRAYF